MSPERYLSSKDIQAALGVSRARAYDVIRQMPRLKFGQNVRVSESDFAAWLKAHELPPPPPTLAEERRLRIEARKRVTTIQEPASPFRIRPTRPRD